MKKLLALSLLTFSAFGQQIIPLDHKPVPGVSYENPEKQFYSEAWQTQVVTNVSKPVLMVYEPEEGKKNGTSVIIAPGGGLYGLSINSEGIDVAKWLNEKGITAFVLKYRLVPTGEDGSTEIGVEMRNSPGTLFRKVAEVLPYSVNDGLTAIGYVRTHAKEMGIDPGKIGFMGFSAGGAVTMGVAYNYTKDSRPDFLVPVYAWTTAQPVRTAPQDGPPMLLVCATDDGLGLAAGTIDIYNSWYTQNLTVGLHLYSKGDHGFGMKKQGLPSDHWIERFYDWAVTEKIVSE
ncbi:1,4-beta-xylanase [Jiulongibacter sediminis]|uniref:1,4-beta-xylanase n=2 Tax=Jiulongibacter sediminis TaxID=1605367 RepID=A0A0P7BI91_9BACT|nr:1,4-beta-xylanase [Jiulongibacter sediminis]TBX21716.1 1,4-beta-xylanase [Jiulongibacter sediminis]